MNFYRCWVCCSQLLFVHASSRVWQQAQSPCRQRSLSRGCHQQYLCEQKGYITRGEYTILCYSGKRDCSRVMWKESAKRLLTVPQYNGVSVSCSIKVLIHRIRYKAKYLKCSERLAEMKFYWASIRFNTELNFDVSASIWLQTKGEEYCVTVEARKGLRPSFPLLCLWPNTALLFEWQQTSLLACISHQISVLVTNFYYPEVYSFFCGTNTIRNFSPLSLDASYVRRVLSLLVFYVLAHFIFLNYFLLYSSLSHLWYNKIVISLYFNYKGEASTPVLPFILLQHYLMITLITGRNMSQWMR